MWVFVGKHWYFRDRHDYARRDYITPLENYAAAHPEKRGLQDKVAKAVATIKNDPEYQLSTRLTGSPTHRLTD